MSHCHHLVGLICVLLLEGQASAGDLSQIERKIIKEPSYKSKPKYCLLVFGVDAKARVWLALDGDVLYVDRNGNGDLTEKSERVSRDDDGSNANFISFNAGDIYESRRVHKNLRV